MNTWKKRHPISATKVSSLQIYNVLMNEATKAFFFLNFGATWKIYMAYSTCHEVFEMTLQSTEGRDIRVTTEFPGEPSEFRPVGGFLNDFWKEISAARFFVPFLYILKQKKQKRNRLCQGLPAGTTYASPTHMSPLTAADGRIYAN